MLVVGSWEFITLESSPASDTMHHMFSKTRYKSNPPMEMIKVSFPHYVIELKVVTHNIGMTLDDIDWWSVSRSQHSFGSNGGCGIGGDGR